MKRPVDMTDAELQLNQQANNPLLNEVVREMMARGLRVKPRLLKWNKRTAGEALLPFIQVAEAVPGRLPKPVLFTDAGGGVFKKKGHPEKRCVDSYVTIRTLNVYVTFACHIVSHTDEPLFILKDHIAKSEDHYRSDELDCALAAWKSIADRAGRSRLNVWYRRPDQSLPTRDSQRRG